MGTYVVLGLLTLLLLQAAFDLSGQIAGLLGRNATLTGRTDIWRVVLKENTNPLFGVGFSSFWMGDRVDRLSAAYFYQLNEAHNGYLEVYLNSGLVGVSLLAILLVHGFHRAKRMVVQDVSLGSLRLAFLIGACAYAITEAVFNRLGLVWFVLLWASMEYPRLETSALEARTDFVGWAGER
jgi:O-antigen ligase